MILFSFIFFSISLVVVSSWIYIRFKFYMKRLFSRWSDEEERRIWKRRNIPNKYLYVDYKTILGYFIWKERKEVFVLKIIILDWVYLMIKKKNHLLSITQTSTNQNVLTSKDSV